MKRRIELIAFLLVLSLNHIFGQDLISLKNGEEIKAKVLEINTTEIKYKKFDNLDGPVISISKSNVSMIKYQNGTQDVISSPSLSSNVEKPKEKKTVDSKPNRFGLYVNPLGFVQFGPMAGMELTLASHFIIDAHVRFSSMGLLMYVITRDDEDGAPYQISGIGVGGAIKLLIPSRIGGFYIGVLIEDGSQKQYYAQNKSWNWMSESNYVAVAPDFGYKFRFQSGLYLNTGFMFGAAFVNKDQWHYLKNYNGDSSIHENSPHVQPFGMVELGIGFEF